MCERYALIPDSGFTKLYVGAITPKLNLSANYNVAAGQTMPVLTAAGLELMKWGLVPSGAKEFKASFTSINARGETLSEKPLYKIPFQQHRALVPASGFYAWQQRPTFKQPYYFSIPERPIFYFAGLFDIWTNAAGETQKSFTIITTTPTALVGEVQDRMPVILRPEDEARWLNPATTPEQLQLLLKPYDQPMTAHEVNRIVANVKNNTESLILPLK